MASTEIKPKCEYCGKRCAGRFCNSGCFKRWIKREQSLSRGPLRRDYVYSNTGGAR